MGFNFPQCRGVGFVLPEPILVVLVLIRTGAAGMERRSIVCIRSVGDSSAHGQVDRVVRTNHWRLWDGNR